MSRSLRTLQQLSTRSAMPETNDPFEEEEGLEDELKAILSNIIDENYIINATGVKDVSRVEYVSLVVDTKVQSLYDLHEILPNLKHLVLDNSHITSIRDLGVGLKKLESLSLSGCNIRDLDGIGVLTELKELCLSDNFIQDISPLALHDNLETLNLSGNRICDLAFGMVLSSCRGLKSVFLARNPLDRLEPNTYRSLVAYLLPGIKMLDGVPVEGTKTMSSQGVEEAQDQLAIIAEEIESEQRLEDEISGANRPEREAVDTFRPVDSTTSKSVEYGSELTHGSGHVFAGAAAANMLRRRQCTNSKEDGNIESALEVLEGKSMYTHTTQGMVEGDITHSVLRGGHGAAGLLVVDDLEYAPYSSDSPAKPIPTPNTSTRQSRVTQSFDTDYGSMSQRGSPRQHNNLSRPHSAAYNSSNSNSNSGNGDGNGESLFKTRALPFAVTTHHHTTAGNEDDSDHNDDDPQDGAPSRTTTNAARPAIAASTSTNGGSLVHQNLVRRIATLPTSNSDNDNDSEDDCEHIAVSRAERLRLMATNDTNTSTSNAALLRSRQTVLDRLRSTGMVSSSSDNANANNAGQSNASGNASGVNTTPSRPPRPTSRSTTGNHGHANSRAHQVGRALGIDLQHSLAAIDLWTDSSSGSSDTLPSIGSDVSSGNGNGKAGDMNSASDHTKADGDSSSDGVLSRDAIFQMCWGSSPPPSSRSRPVSATTATARPQPSPRTMATLAASTSEAVLPPTNAMEAVPPAARPALPATPTRGSAANGGMALHMSDAELVELLRKPPKTVVALRTKSGFQDFFRGMPIAKFRRLLEMAYADIADAKDREAKIQRRLELLESTSR